jgi:hypothetical protein
MEIYSNHHFKTPTVATKPSTPTKRAPADLSPEAAAQAIQAKLDARLSAKAGKKTTRAKKPSPAKTAAKGKAVREVGAKPLGRPSSFTQEIADEICERLAEGESLRSICLADNMPSKGTVFRWLAENKLFQDQYTRAREEQAETLTDEMVEIADNASNDWMENHDPDNPGYRLNGEHVQRSKLRIETRKWAASKLKPKKYGDKVDLNHGVQPENPLAVLLAQVAGTGLPVVKAPEDDSQA